MRKSIPVALSVALAAAVAVAPAFAQSSSSGSGNSTTQPSTTQQMQNRGDANRTGSQAQTQSQPRSQGQTQEQTQGQAQGRTQGQNGQSAVSVVILEPVVITQGYRASKVIGEDIVNSAGDKIGTVDDLVIRADDKVFFAILSVGGFLGMGSKLVAVPYDALGMQGEDLVLPGADKDRLSALPEFKYPETSSSKN